MSTLNPKARQIIVDYDRRHPRGWLPDDLDEGTLGLVTLPDLYNELSLMWLSEMEIVRERGYMRLTETARWKYHQDCQHCATGTDHALPLVKDE